jgi:hypothetical protein
MAAPKKAFNEVGELLGGSPPKEFNNLSAEELAELARLLSESIDLHEASIARAEEDVIQAAPRPLRGTVRRLLGA